MDTKIRKVVKTGFTGRPMKESYLPSSLSKVLDLCWVNKPLFYPSKTPFHASVTTYTVQISHNSSEFLLFTVYRDKTFV